MTLLGISGFGQKKTATVSGKIVDENENPMGRVSIIILGRVNGIMTSDSGSFRITVPADKAFALVISFLGYKTEQRNFLLNEVRKKRLLSEWNEDPRTWIPWW
jgi:hypothetical protein